MSPHSGSECVGAQSKQEEFGLILGGSIAIRHRSGTYGGGTEQGAEVMVPGRTTPRFAT